MWFPLTGIDGGEPLVETGRFRYVTIAEDIETLNRRAAEVGDLEVTALSIAALPGVADRYALTTCGASLGEAYGPRIVTASGERDLEWLRGHLSAVTIAVPGRRTSAFLATSLLLGEFAAREVPFDRIAEEVLAGRAEAGVLIHEGQLTHESQGLHCAVDLGEWWTGETDLPLPLGGNAIRRDLEAQYGAGTLAEIATAQLRSIRYALEHREEAVEFALRFGRGLDRELADRFVSMYVNRLTVDLGARGRAGVQTFLERAEAAGLTRPRGTIDFVEPVSGAE